MHYEGGARVVLPDGSIELVGRPEFGVGVAIGFIVAVLIVAGNWPDLVPFAYLAGVAAFLVHRSPRRQLRFDATARVLRITDRASTRDERTIPFSTIRDVAVEQREPRRIANAPPVLVVNGEELLAVKDTYANAQLERELQALVGLPPHPSRQDRGGVSWP